MFLIDDVVREIVAYVRERNLDSRDERGRDVRYILEGLYEFEVALAEIEICLTRELDELAARTGDPAEFYRELADFLGSGELHRLASPAHVCAGLHRAYDRLRLAKLDDQASVWGDAINLRTEMSQQIAGALAELRVIRPARDSSPEAVVASLQRRIRHTAAAMSEIRALLDARDPRFTRRRSAHLARASAIERSTSR